MGTSDLFSSDRNFSAASPESSFNDRRGSSRRRDRNATGGQARRRGNRHGHAAHERHLRVRRLFFLLLFFCRDSRLFMFHCEGQRAAGFDRLHNVLDISR